MASTTTMRLVDFLPLMAQEIRGWHGKLRTSSASGVDNTIIAEDFGRRGFIDPTELLEHWILTPFDGTARRVVKYDPDSFTATLSAGETIQFEDRLEFWLFNESPYALLEALTFALMENPNLVSMYRDFIVRLHDEETRIPEGGMSITGLTTPNGAWRRFWERLEIWLPDFDEVVDVRLGSPITSSLFEGEDENSTYYIRLNRLRTLEQPYWEWDGDRETLTVSYDLWQRVVTITVKEPELRAMDLVDADMLDAFTLQIGAPTNASSVYPDGLTSRRIMTLVNLAVAKWAQSASLRAEGTRALELNRWETHHRNLAERNYPLPPAVRK